MQVQPLGLRLPPLPRLLLLLLLVVVVVVMEVVVVPLLLRAAAGSSARPRQAVRVPVGGVVRVVAAVCGQAWKHEHDGTRHLLLGCIKPGVGMLAAPSKPTEISWG